MLRIVEYLVRNIYLFHIWYTSMYCRDEGIMVKKCGRCSYDNTDQSKYCSRCGTLLFAAPLTIPTALATKHIPTALATKPISSIMQPPARSITSIGMCFYHHNLPALHICGRCGRQICRHCSLSRTGLVLCVECSDKFLHP